MKKERCSPSLPCNLVRKDHLSTGQRGDLTTATWVSGFSRLRISYIIYIFFLGTSGLREEVLGCFLGDHLSPAGGSLLRIICCLSLPLAGEKLVVLRNWEDDCDLSKI